MSQNKHLCYLLTICFTHVWHRKQITDISQSQNLIYYKFQSFMQVYGRTNFMLLSKTYTHMEKTSHQQQSRCQPHKVLLCVSDVFCSGNMHWQKYASNWCVMSFVFSHHQRDVPHKLEAWKTSYCNPDLGDRKKYNLIYFLLQQQIQNILRPSI